MMLKRFIYITACITIMKLGGSSRQNASANACASVSASTSAASDVKAGAEIKSGSENPSLVKMKEMPTSIAIQGDIAAVVTSDNSVNVFKINPQTGAFGQVTGSPFKTGKRPSSIAIQGDIAAVTNFLDDSLSVFKIDAQTAQFKPVPGSPFRTGSMPKKISMSGNIAVVLNTDDSINIYRIDESGQFISLSRWPHVAQLPESIAISDDIIIVSDGLGYLYVYKINKNTGQFISGLRSSLPALRSIAIHGDIVVGTHKDDNSVSALQIDRNTGQLHLVPGSPFDIKKRAFSIATNGDITAVVHKAHSISVFKIDSKTRQFRAVPGSPFRTGNWPDSIAIGGDIAAVTNSGDGTVSIYEIDRETGAFSPLTGQLLKSVRAQKEMYDALGQHAPALAQQQGIGDIISSYVQHQPADAKKTAEKEKKKANALKEAQQEKELQDKIAKTKAEQEAMNNDAERLFDAISRGDSTTVREFRTPFTINARDKENKTPLMRAVIRNNEGLVRILLGYKGIKYFNAYDQEEVTAQLNAQDDGGNTALMFAIIYENFAIALRLAQKMNKEGITLKRKDGETAYSLAVQEKERFQNDEEFKKLIEKLTEMIKQ